VVVETTAFGLPFLCSLFPGQVQRVRSAVVNPEGTEFALLLKPEEEGTGVGGEVFVALLAPFDVSLLLEVCLSI